MQPPGERPVHGNERVVNPQSRTSLDWESAHLFLEVARYKSFRGAAEHLDLSVNALRKRISDFEKSLGVMLITRHNDGIRLTAEGDRIYEAVSAMEQGAFALAHARDHVSTAVEGEVRLGVTEGLGALWVAPHLVEFQRANPKLLLDVHCAMRSADVLRLEADISVQLQRPTQKELIVTKIGRMHLVPFAAQSYINTYSKPANLAELVAKHGMVIQADDEPKWEALYQTVFPGKRPEGFVTLRTNVSSAHYWSIVNGAGVGMLPTYVYAVGAPIVPLEIPELYMALDIWMTYHPDVAKIPRVRRLIEWLQKAFLPKNFPWFRDEFIRPQDLLGHYRGKALQNPVAGFVAPTEGASAGRRGETRDTGRPVARQAMVERNAQKARRLTRRKKLP